jgi:hypothetical protein
MERLLRTRVNRKENFIEVIAWQIIPDAGLFVVAARQHCG